MIVPEIKNPTIATTSGTIVYYALPNSALEYNFNEHDYEIVKSVINGDKDIVSKGSYFKGSITVMGLAYADYISYQNLIGTLVRLWFFGTGLVTDDPDTFYPYTDCICTNVVPFHDAKKLYEDACVIYLESQKIYVLELADNDGVEVPV
jgi:hypothetical protein